jgi:3-oxoacyl-(acyl-carrier-protein) synthase
MSCNYGGVEYYFDNLYRLYRMGPSFVSAYMAIAWIPSAPVGQLSIFMGISGYTKTIINDGTGGLDAIGAAYNSIRRDDCDVAITGGFEAVIAEPAILAVATWPGSCREKSNPESAFRPYSINR